MGNSGRDRGLNHGCRIKRTVAAASRRRRAGLRRSNAKRSARAVHLVLLLVLVAIVFEQAITYDFVNYDDDVYVTENPQISHGLTWPGVAWAFTTDRGQLWVPVTWLSLMVDAQLFGQAAWGYHLTNLLLHAATSMGLFSCCGE